MASESTSFFMDVNLLFGGPTDDPVVRRPEVGSRSGLLLTGRAGGRADRADRAARAIAREAAVGEGIHGAVDAGPVEGDVGVGQPDGGTGDEESGGIPADHAVVDVGSCPGFDVDADVARTGKHR